MISMTKMLRNICARSSVSTSQRPLSPQGEYAAPARNPGHFQAFIRSLAELPYVVYMPNRASWEGNDGAFLPAH
jgi:hypothetical protein